MTEPWLLMSVLFFGSDPDAMQFNDVLAASRQVASEVKTLRVTWRRKKEYTDANREYHRERVPSLERLLQSPEGKEHAEQWRAEMESSRRFSTDDMVRWSDQDFWTDWDNFQLRRFFETKSTILATRPGSVAPGVVFPNATSHRENLKTGFPGIEIFSQGSATENLLRAWDGRPGGVPMLNPQIPQHPGRIIENMTFGGDLMGLLAFPPLVPARPEWIVVPHPLTHVFGNSEGKGLFWGEVELDGHPTFLVGRTWKRSDGGNAGLRAFVRPDLGYLPVRVEFQLGLSETVTPKLRPIAGDIDYATIIIRCTRVEEVHPGFFYPMEGVIEGFGVSAEQVRRPKTHPPSYALKEITSWQVTKIEVNRPMDSEMFALKFPEGTRFYDGGTGLGAVEGDAEKFVRNAMPQPRSSGSRWLTYLFALVASGAAFIFGGRFWRKRTR